MVGGPAPGRRECVLTVSPDRGGRDEYAWREVCPRLGDALPYILGELGEAEHRDYCEHLLEGCAVCGRELEVTRWDLASLDLALTDRTQLGAGRAAFEETRAALGLRLRARISATGTDRSSAAGQSALLKYLFRTVLGGRNAHLADGVQHTLGWAPRDFREYVHEVATAGLWQTATLGS